MENLVKPVTSAFFLVCHNRWHTEAILEGKVKMPFIFGGGGGGLYCHGNNPSECYQ